mgnify:FL=1
MTTTIDWTQKTADTWVSDEISDGLQGHVFVEKASDGVIEYWASTRLDDDFDGPMETPEVFLSLEDAQQAVADAFSRPSPSA